MNSVAAIIWKDIQAIRSSGPVILNVTNLVAMDFTANALLAVGASPIMAHAPEELSELVELARAVVVNIGTLDSCWVQSFKMATLAAKGFSRPVVMDPVGSGASAFRTETARSLLESGGVSLVRGNASEVLSLFAGVHGTKGVDSSVSSEQVRDVIRNSSEAKAVGVAVTGRVDLVFAEGREGMIQNGHPTMSRVTAMGCVASALSAAFLAVDRSVFNATVGALTVMGICGEVASAVAQGPGTFRAAFLDSLSNVSFEDLEERARVFYENEV